MNSSISGRQNCLVRAFHYPGVDNTGCGSSAGSIDSRPDCIAVVPLHRQSAPAVRPIVRDRAGHPVELGSKPSVSPVDGIARVDTLRWDAFAETGDLISQRDACQRRDGHYPAKVLADGVYGNRTNRRWLKVHGIAFADKPLGRPPRRTPAEQKTANAQRHADAGAHIPIEGKCGQGKGAYGLDTSETCGSGSSPW